MSKKKKKKKKFLMFKFLYLVLFVFIIKICFPKILSCWGKNEFVFLFFIFNLKNLK
jgi:hypothetical protein